MNGNQQQNNNNNYYYNYQQNQQYPQQPIPTDGVTHNKSKDLSTTKLLLIIIPLILGTILFYVAIVITELTNDMSPEKLEAIVDLLKEGEYEEAADKFADIDNMTTDDEQRFLMYAYAIGGEEAYNLFKKKTMVSIGLEWLSDYNAGKPVEVWFLHSPVRKAKELEMQIFIDAYLANVPELKTALALNGTWAPISNHIIFDIMIIENGNWGEPGDRTYIWDLFIKKGNKNFIYYEDPESYRNSGIHYYPDEYSDTFILEYIYSDGRKESLVYERIE